MQHACERWETRENFNQKTSTKESTWKTKHKGKDNIKINLKELVCEIVDGIYLAEDRVQWRAVLSTVMNIQVQKGGEFWLGERLLAS